MKDNKAMGRRGFLKTAAAIGAALTIAPALDKAMAAEAAIAGSNGARTHKNGMEHCSPAKLLRRIRVG